MSKIWLITKREYLTRVRNKTFLLSTFLLPLVIILFLVGSVIISQQTKSRHRIAVMDANGYFKDYLKGDSAISFDFSPAVDSTNYEKKGCTAVLIIPVLTEGQKTICRLKYKKQLGLEGGIDLEHRITNAITDHQIYQQARISRGMLDSIRKRSDIAEMRSYEDQGKTVKESSQTSSYVIGYVSGILIYILTFIYGAMVMRGVMEEKTNRIAEVVVSSVKPFELMMGKITGIGAVGLTQFLLWIVLLVGLAAIGQGFISADNLKDVQHMQQTSPMGGGASSLAHAGESSQLSRLLGALGKTNILLVIFCFLFYFIGGYLFMQSALSRLSHVLLAAQHHIELLAHFV